MIIAYYQSIYFCIWICWKHSYFSSRSPNFTYIIPSIYLSWYAVYLQAWWKIQEIKRFLINLNLSRLNWWIQGACTILLFYHLTPLPFSLLFSFYFSFSFVLSFSISFSFSSPFLLSLPRSFFFKGLAQSSSFIFLPLSYSLSLSLSFSLSYNLFPTLTTIFPSFSF